MPRRAWVIILAQLAIIVSFSLGFLSEYLNNTYFQNYVNSLAPILVPVISVAFGVCSATIATFLYFGTRKISQTLDTDTGTPVKKRSHTRRPTKRNIAVSEQRAAKTAAESPTGVPRPRFIITDSTANARPGEAGAGKKESK